MLRQRFNIPYEYDETTASDKFTVALYFDHELNFLPDKLFLTLSGVLRETGDFPNSITELEDALKQTLTQQFDEDFHRTMTSLLTRYHVNETNFRYSFLQNIDHGSTNLHSFFIKDLQKAKTLHTENLTRYFEGFSGMRQNLNSQRDSEHFNEALLEDVLQPKHYPNGRFPTNTTYALSLMQQVAVNIAVNDDANTIRSVNGPPGTGKTTLLKDVFADLLVEQAITITAQPSKQLPGTITYYKSGKIAPLLPDIAKNNIVVASSNNGAVQNIVNELPKLKDIDVSLQHTLLQADYFTQLANEDDAQQEDTYENWGVFSLEGGRAANVANVLSHIDNIITYLQKDYVSNPAVYDEFLALYHDVQAEKQRAQSHYEQTKQLRQLQQQYENEQGSFLTQLQAKGQEVQHEKQQLTSELQQLQQLQQQTLQQLQQIDIALQQSDNEQVTLNRQFALAEAKKPSFFARLFQTAAQKQYVAHMEQTDAQLTALETKKTQLLQQQTALIQQQSHTKQTTTQKEQALTQLDDQLQRFKSTLLQQLENMKTKIDALTEQLSTTIPMLDFSVSYDDLQKSNPWFTETFRERQSKLFIAALNVRKQFLYENSKHVKAAYNIWDKKGNYIAKENGTRLLTEAWQWINFTIPVISTTFASFGRMFEHIGENAIGQLFVDEAGQALPQASVGAIFRSQRVMVVGDPSQIKPVLTLDANVLTLISRHFNVDEQFISADASTQTLVDAASQYGFQKSEDEWIGIPLWVHRRCNDPMFTISNRISYHDLMVQGKKEEDAQGIATWIHCPGTANDKFVQAQADCLIQEISMRLSANPSLKDDIYVISPFRKVALELAAQLKKINFTKYENGKPTNVGTVHTFQGKEAKIVFFVLGADKNSEGAANWAVGEPNLMNVAVTRAKEQFYIIGDQALYGSLGSTVANETIAILQNAQKRAT